MTRKEFVVIAIATLLTIIGWVGFDIYFKREKTQIPPNLQELIEPLNPNFDLSGLEK